jgi:hypothetical protein
LEIAPHNFQSCDQGGSALIERRNSCGIFLPQG